MAKVVLPKVPSELLKIALEDMQKTIRAGYDIDMNVWGHGNLSKHAKEECSVCFAGAVMLQRTMKDEKDLSTFGIKTSDPNHRQYEFLDSIRAGNLGGAMSELDIEYPLGKGDRYTYQDWADYIEGWVEFHDCESNRKFYKQVRDLIKYLEKLGL